VDKEKTEKLIGYDNNNFRNINKIPDVKKIYGKDDFDLLIQG